MGHLRESTMIAERAGRSPAPVFVWVKGVGQLVSAVGCHRISTLHCSIRGGSRSVTNIFREPTERGFFPFRENRGVRHGEGSREKTISNHRGTEAQRKT